MRFHRDFIQCPLVSPTCVTAACHAIYLSISVEFSLSELSLGEYVRLGGAACRVTWPARDGAERGCSVALQVRFK